MLPEAVETTSRGGYKIHEQHDMLDWSEVKAACNGFEPLQSHLKSVPQLFLRTGANRKEEIVYLFPLNPTSGYRKIDLYFGMDDHRAIMRMNRVIFNDQGRIIFDSSIDDREKRMRLDQWNGLMPTILMRCVRKLKSMRS